MNKLPPPPTPPNKNHHGGLFTTRVLTAASIKMFVRNRQALFFTFFMPVIIMTVFGLIGFDKIPKMKIGIVTDPQTPAIAQFVQRVKQIPAFEVKTGNREEERKAIDKGDRALVIIPESWQKDNPEQPPLRPGEPVAMTIWKNSGNQQANTALSIIERMFDQITLSISQTPPLFVTQVQEINSRNLKYIDFLVPGIVALAIMQMAVFSVGFVFTDYKEKGILKRLLATPMRPYQFVTANIVTRLIVAVIQSTTLIAIGVLIFNAHVFGSYWLLLLITLIGSVMFLSLGFIISGIASTVESVPAIANLIVFPMLFLGGTFFPIESMPDWLQHIVKYMPLTYLSHSLRSVMLDAATFTDIQKDLLWMTAWSTALTFLANITFGFEEKRV